MANGKTSSSSDGRTPQPRRFVFVLLDNFTLLCFSAAMESLRIANRMAGETLYEWVLAGEGGDTITCSAGASFHLDMDLEELRRDDVVMVCGGINVQAATSKKVLNWLRREARRGLKVAGLCTAAYTVAKAGLLDGKRATIHWDELENLAERFPDTEVTEDRFVLDGNRITCGGTTTTFELMLHLIGQHHGAMLRLEVAALFMHGEADPRADPLMRLPRDRLVQAAVSIMRRNIETPLPVGQIAERLNLSQRGLEAHFARATGMSPRAVYTALRLRQARLLAERTTLSVAEIATRCGYSDASAMTRAFRREFGQPPSAFRTT